MTKCLVCGASMVTNTIRGSFAATGPMCGTCLDYKKLNILPFPHPHWLHPSDYEKAEVAQEEREALKRLLKAS